MSKLQKLNQQFFPETYKYPRMENWKEVKVKPEKRTVEEAMKFIESFMHCKCDKCKLK